MFFQCFHLSIVKRLFASLATSARDRYQHDVLQGAHVQNSSLCVTSGALRFGTKNHTFHKCSTYVTFSTIFCAPVRRTTVCVAPRARRRFVPSGLLGDPLAASAARSRPECRHEPDLSELDPPRPARRTPDMLQERRRAPIPTTKVVSSVGGDAMYMKWLDEIGLGSWEWGSPTSDRASQRPA